MTTKAPIRIAIALPTDSAARAELADHFGDRARLLEAAKLSAKSIEQLDLVVADKRHPDAAELVRTVKLKRSTSRTPVVTIYPEAVSPNRDPELTIVADRELTEPLTPGSLGPYAEQLLTLTSARPRHFALDFLVRLGTEEEQIEAAHGLFDELLAELGYNEYDQVTLGHSFREALGNAAEHGNDKDPERMLLISYMVDREKLLLIVTDEGPGFDHHDYMSKANKESAYTTTTGRSDEVRPGGLGVHIMKTACDSIEFNKSGNSIFLMKYLPGADTDSDNNVNGGSSAEV